jgi:uncharacterized membrane protein
MTVELSTLLAIVAMAAATILTRTSGLFLMNRLTLNDRQKKVLDAIPPAVLMAVIAPVALATGPAETIAAAVTALAAMRLPLLASTGLGVITVAILRLVL